MSTQDNKNLLSCYIVLATNKTYLAGEWIRHRKYKEDGIVHRDFANKQYPVMVTVIEDGDTLKIKQEKIIPPWDFLLITENEAILDNWNEIYYQLEDDQDLEKFENNSYNKSLKNSLKPSDFLFSIHKESCEWKPSRDVMCLGLTPIEYWKNERCAYDDHIDMKGLLPSFIDETDIMECLWEFNVKMDQEDAKQQLINHGFICDPKYQEYMSSF